MQPNMEPTPNIKVDRESFVGYIIKYLFGLIIQLFKLGFIAVVEPGLTLVFSIYSCIWKVLSFVRKGILCILGRYRSNPQTTDELPKDLKRLQEEIESIERNIEYHKKGNTSTEGTIDTLMNELALCKKEFNKLLKIRAINIKKKTLTAKRKELMTLLESIHALQHAASEIETTEDGIECKDDNQKTEDAIETTISDMDVSEIEVSHNSELNNSEYFSTPEREVSEEKGDQELGNGFNN